MANGFEADLSRFLDHFNGNMGLTLRHTVVLASQGVIFNTPVLSGRLRNNWQFGKAFPSGEVPGVDVSGAAALSRIAGQTGDLEAGGQCWIVNNLPYSAKIEYGHSRVKAPQGMVRITLANLPNAIESYVRGLQ